MPATTYRVMSFGAAVGEGIHGARHVAVAGIAKASTPDFPTHVANELIAGDLGRALRLPIPPGFIVRHDDDGTPYHVSLNFSLTGEALPPVDPASVAAYEPALSCGVVLFDLWVVNIDRNTKNMAWDEDSRTLQLFDHGSSLTCDSDDDGRLQSPGDKHLIAEHILTPEIRQTTGFEEWATHIKALPESYIVGAVQSAVGLGLETKDAGPLTEFLLERRNGLMDIVRAHRAAFVKADGSLFI